MARIVRVDLLTATTEAGPGKWLNLADFDVVSIEVAGMAVGDIVHIEGTNGLKPDLPEIDPNIGTQIGDDVLADGFYVPSALPLWIRGHLVDNSGGGTVTVSLFARGEE